MDNKRVRSPNYPSLSLREAVEKIMLVYRALQQHPAPREVIAKSLGYNGLNGASATVISTLNKYGLLDGRGEDLRVSERALSILHPHSDKERAAALRAAAMEPRLFADLAERFPGGITNDDLLKNYLLRNGFAINAVTSVIQAYRETSDFVEQEAGRYDSASQPEKEPTHMMRQEVASVSPVPHSSLVQLPVNARLLHKHQVASGGYIEIIIPLNLKPSVAVRLIEASLPSIKAQIEIEESEGIGAEPPRPEHEPRKDDERGE